MFTLRDIETKGQKATQAVANVVTGLFGGGIRGESHYEATADPDAYLKAITEYGVALESAVMALLRPALAGEATK